MTAQCEGGDGLATSGEVSRLGIRNRRGASQHPSGHSGTAFVTEARLAVKPRQEGPWQNMQFPFLARLDCDFRFEIALATGADSDGVLTRRDLSRHRTQAIKAWRERASINLD